MKKKRCPSYQSFKFPFSQQGVVQRHGAKATKKLGAGGGAHLAGLRSYGTWVPQLKIFK